MIKLNKLINKYKYIYNFRVIIDEVSLINSVFNYIMFQLLIIQYSCRLRK